MRVRTEMPTAKKKSVNGNYNAILKKLALNEEVTAQDWEITDNMTQGINDRYSGCTFDFQTALRVLLAYKEKIPDAYLQKIKAAFTGYRFFMTMPGGDDMVLWSENLQIQLAVSEYFTALLWNDAVFSADGKSAREHLSHARQRIGIWLRQRWLYGFSEWNTPTYYVEDVSPLCLLIDFAPEPRLRTQAAIILDLLLYDIAAGQYNGVLGSTAGRCYSAGRRLDHYTSTGAVTAELLGTEPGAYNGMLNNFRYRKPDGYKIPEVLLKIARDRECRVYRASHGLYLHELQEKNLIGRGDAQIMMQWAMESFSNPETIANTLAYCRRHKLFNNANFRELKYFDFLRIPGLLRGASRLLNLFTNGIVLERANTYTYKTPYYLQAAAQMYSPKSHGAQQHVWTVNLGEFAVFASNPYGEYGKGDFWVGDGVKPFVAQEKNITLAIYDTRVRGLKIRKILRYTHAHFPAGLFDRTDESMLAQGKIFGEKKGAFVALTAGRSIQFVGDRRNLVQDGAVTAWVCETSDRDRESFEAFVRRVAGNHFAFDGKTLVYSSRGVRHELRRDRTFRVDGRIQDLEYWRFDSDFAQVEREATQIAFHYGEGALHLDFGAAERWEN